VGEVKESYRMVNGGEKTHGCITESTGTNQINPKKTKCRYRMLSKQFDSKKKVGHTGISYRW